MGSKRGWEVLIITVYPIYIFDKYIFQSMSGIMDIQFYSMAQLYPCSPSSSLQASFSCSLYTTKNVFTFLHVEFYGKMDFSEIQDDRRVKYDIFKKAYKKNI